MSTDKLLILIDGSSFLFRAYHALPELTNARGQHTGAIYGITNMMRKLVGECQPVYLAAVFDAKGKTFRHDMYEQYKANRPPMPDDLRSQLELVQQVIRAMGLPLVSIEGVEADDVIGTLASLATLQGFDTMIVSIESDAADLISGWQTSLRTDRLWRAAYCTWP